MHSCCLLSDTKTDVFSPGETGKRFLAHGGLGRRGRAASAPMVTPPQGEQAGKTALALARPA